RRNGFGRRHIHRLGSQRHVCHRNLHANASSSLPESQPGSATLLLPPFSVTRSCTTLTPPTPRMTTHHPPPISPPRSRLGPTETNGAHIESEARTVPCGPWIWAKAASAPPHKSISSPRFGM